MNAGDTAESPEDMPLPAVAGGLEDSPASPVGTARSPRPGATSGDRESRGAESDEAGTDGGTGSHGRRDRGRGARGRQDQDRSQGRKRGGRRQHGQHGRRQQWPGFTAEQLAARASSVPAVVYPEELPVSARREEIAAAIRDHQVVIVAGETGSGKTTQLPKICLELGRGVTGMIGHTQPRRIAARSVAERIAHELGTPIGRDGVVGYQVRFTEETGPTTLVKLMTDGILLAEIQSDPMLRRYDTIIVDEAHERSLTIDFILGYLARLLPERPDLKVIITSATIDSARFAEHFGRALTREAPGPGGGRGPGAHGARDTTEPGPTAVLPAPVIEVSGRTYPVEIRYRPLTSEDGDEQDSQDGGARSGPPAQEDRDQVTGILDAVDELIATGPGDILVFLAGERDIRDTEAALIDHLGPRYTPDGRSRTPGAVEVVPLYSRLSAAEQHRVFEAHATRRIVLATNVAETSLTVPGIHYVVDPGLARISRYSNRTKVQRLPIEAVSQASANQRSGRCGRVADGVAIRLYSEADFLARPEYTEPEILRTSLASVILQMAALGLGAVQDFPFLDAPDPRAVRDGIQLLTEIGAIEPYAPGGSPRPERGPASRGPRLTAVGRRLARLPIDPRLGRMLLEAGELGCAGEVMVIVAALSIQDVRERPADRQEAADAMHRRFADRTSDFLTYLNLWRYLRTQSRELSGSAFRRMCRTEFLHYLRVREWLDVHAQLRQLARPLGLEAAPVELPTARAIRAARQALEPGSHEAQIAHGDVAAAVVALGRSADTPDADSIHRSLLVGLLSNVGNWDERRREYAGARGTRFTIWPGSGLRRTTYDWVMTAELVETSRLFARTVAKVDPRWVEEAAERAGLARHVVSEPYWSTRHGAAMVHEKVLLYGMTLVADRPRTLASVGTPAAREVAREMFLRSGLVEGAWHARHGFVERNRALLEELAEVEHRRRTRGLLADDEALLRFYDDRLPEEVTEAEAFDAWWRRERSRHPDLLDFTRELLLPQGEDTSGFPDSWVQGDLTLPLSYRFEPGRADDGVSVQVPVEVLGRVAPEGFEWLVPGLRPELVVATIRALPKRVRRQLVPAPDVGAQVWREILARYPQAGAPEPAGAPEGPGASAPGGGQDTAPPVSFRRAFSQAVLALRQVEIDDEDWAEARERLPEHLRVSFAALDADGGELGRSPDLIDLRTRLAESTEQAVRSAVHGAVAQAMAEARQRSGRHGHGGTDRAHATRGARGTGSRSGSRRGRGGGRSPDAGGRSGTRGTVPGGAVPGGTLPGLAERTGLEDWPVEVPGLEPPDRSTIPETIESTGTAGLVVRGYPTLVATGARTASLTILPDAVAQARSHGAGVTALALARTFLPTGRVTSRWTATESLTLAASPYRTTDALVEDIELAAARVVARRWAAQAGRDLGAVRERVVFEQLVGHVRDHLEDEVLSVARTVVRVLQAHREVERTVAAHSSLALLATLQEVREQAAALVGDGFVSATPPEQLAHLPRYLTALAMRVGKAQAAPAQDAALAHQVREAVAVVDRARERAAGLEPDPEREAVLEEARWLIEELRVSLFAQTLGTSRKVSLKRISKLVAGI
ncbi:ATP-dependent RNA helicase HrpA [Actinomyces howellii]|uniref:ATP-dependent RNA helicase HrpA n=1 Tax=Actinomyces howellii TaxID=52771 RepID=A0A3S4R4F5_9ACTO|nr:ATP-dependent RNA helicase HrpA [Actinomyces howellii]VEG29316.1 ATP-dependent RNA helicase HrpA [Actinomyces howellii]